MDLHRLRDLVASLFVMLDQWTYILFRIEFLVVVVTVLYLAMFIMDIFRRHFHNVIMKAIFSIFDAVSDSILTYLIGVMGNAPFENKLFPVWVLVLIIFRYSVGFISGYGIPDPSGRRFTEWRTVTNLFTTASLIWRHGSRSSLPLWFLLALQMLRSMYRFISSIRAFKSIWHGLSSDIISEYMRSSGINWKPEDCNPETMYGYRYLVFGELAKLVKPRYVLTLVENNDEQQQQKKKKITLDDIWRCHGSLLLLSHEQDLKDLSLAFALSRILRCRLEDVTLPRDILHRINRNLIKKQIIDEEDVKRAFRIMELQLAFVNDYFNTRYPIVFWLGLRSLCYSLIFSVATIGAVLWLSVDIRKLHKPHNTDLSHVVHGFNVEMIITWTFMLFLVFKEIWEMIIYLLSDWTILLLVCEYVSGNKEGDRNKRSCMEHLILSFFRSKINAKRWHGHLDQYVFLQYYDDRPRFWNLIHKLTMGMLPKKDEGAKLHRAVDLPEYVMPAVLKKLHAILSQNSPAADDPANMGFLPKVITILCNEGTGRRKDRYGWACFNLRTSSHVILVWHIATSLCEMALAKKHGVELSKPAGFLRSLVSCFASDCTSKPYLIHVDEQKKEKNKVIKCGNPGCRLCSLLPLINGCCPSSKSSAEVKDKLTEELRKRYIIANSLSRYCTYLLVSKPGFIPDNFLVPKMVFRRTVKSARDQILTYCDSLESRYTKLSLEGYKAAEASDEVKKGDDVLKQGALLAKELLDHENDGCWEILAGVWTELLIHIAPTWNAAEHRASLESGGEFITNIWALLWHCGIEKSSLWPECDVSEEDVPAAPQDNDARRNNNNPAEVAQQAGADTREHPMETEILNHNNDDEIQVEATEDPDTANLRTGSRAVLVGTGSLKIEEASQDAAGAGTNVQPQNEQQVKG